jgi:hypothetical protein
MLFYRMSGIASLKQIEQKPESVKIGQSPLWIGIARADMLDSESVLHGKKTIR